VNRGLVQTFPRGQGIVVAVTLAGALLVSGCDATGRSLLAARPETPAPPDQQTIEDSEAVFASALPSGAGGAAPAPATSLDVRLRVIKVQVPRAERGAAEAMWKHVREDAVDGETALRLLRNGIRVGVGRTDWWSPMKKAIDGIPDCRVDEMEDVRIPPSFPLALELDDEPREQTLFYMDDDGILSGGTWPESRNVLRLLHAADDRRRDGLHLQVMPEVRQRLSGFRYLRTAAGIWQVPRGGGRDYPAAGFQVRLAPGEFLVIAPSAQADVYGTLGGAFLTESDNGQQRDTLLFLRPEVTDGSQRSE
jgi:hypothetical protein